MESTQAQQFKKGAVEMVLLSVISKGETYGYDILKKLHHGGSNGIFCNAQSGTIYPILRNMKKDGYIKVREEIVRGRTTCFYSITDNGLKLLNEQKMFWKEFVDGVNSYLL